jgi:hypothetical protein
VVAALLHSRVEQPAALARQAAQREAGALALVRSWIGLERVGLLIGDR